ncbi:MAG: PEP-CTERM sorting domain-containing protein [Planctomycetota bacterium]
MTTRDIDGKIQEYGNQSSRPSKLSKAAMVGFGAAAAGGMFTAAQAEADIVYTQIGTTFNTSTGLGLFQNSAVDIDGDSVAEMVLGINAATTGGLAGDPAFVAFRGYWFGGAGGGLVAGGGNVPSNIPASSGSFFSSQVTFTGGNFWMGWNYASNTTGTQVFNPLSLSSNAQSVVIGGVSSSGFNFWLRMDLTNDAAGSPATMTIRDMAYDDDPAATFIKSGAIPEPAAAGLLALAGGAAAIRRRRKSA